MVEQETEVREEGEDEGLRRQRKLEAKEFEEHYENTEEKGIELEADNGDMIDFDELLMENQEEVEEEKPNFSKLQKISIPKLDVGLAVNEQFEDDFVDQKE